jgi:hypothetical protein
MKNVSEFIFSLCFFFLSFSVCAQGYCEVGLSDKKYILDEFKKSEKNDTSFKYTFVENDSSLFVTINGAEKIEFDYYFGSDSLCVCQESRYYCCECGEKHKKQILKSMYKFKRGKDGIYYSKFKMHTSATITSGKEPGSCITIRFNAINITKEEYKQKFSVAK